MSLFIYIVMVLFVPPESYGVGTWLCTEESSQLRDDSLLSCGVAEGRDENEARSKAFDNAKAEFSRLCGVSRSCMHREATVEPLRTSCETHGQGYKCYRLLKFVLGIEKSLDSKDQQETTASGVAPPAAIKTITDTESHKAKRSRAVAGIQKKQLIAGHWTEKCATKLSRTCGDKYFSDIALNSDGTYSEIIVGSERVRTKQGRWQKVGEKLKIFVEHDSKLPTSNYSDEVYYNIQNVQVEALGYQAKRLLELRDHLSDEPRIYLDEISPVAPEK